MRIKPPPDRRKFANECEHVALKGYCYDALSDRLNLLAMLYHDTGALDKAVSTLLESKQLCEKYGIKFEGEAFLRDYQEQERSTQMSVDLL